MITKKGTVVKKSGEKTIKVQVIDYVQHPKYKKRYPKPKNFLVHDEKNEAKEGDVVIISQGNKVSKQKSWKLTQIEK